jgi:hypothetical protein
VHCRTTVLDRKYTPGDCGTLVALGIWVAVSPSSVPWLTEPDQAPIQMEMEMS